MSRVVTFTRSTRSVEKAKAYQRRKSAAKNHMWTWVKENDPVLFHTILEEFNAQFESKLSERGDI